MSVAKMNEAGNDVNPRGDRPHIQNCKTGQVTALRREGKTFVPTAAAAAAAPAAATAAASAAAAAEAASQRGFSRRG